MKQLETYLAENLDKGIIDHAIRADKCYDDVTFYIHPNGHDGETLDFKVKNNLLFAKDEIIDSKKILTLTIADKGNMTFGQVIEALKAGYKVSRQGWNGKGMFIYYVPANSYPANTDIAKKEFGDMVQYNPYFAIKNVNGTVSTWVPSVNDCLSEDWTVVE